MFSSEEFKGLQQIPNFTKEQVVNFIKDIIQFKKFCDEKEWVLFPKDVRLGMKAPVYDNNNNVIGYIPVGGTMDILAWDSKNSKFIIIYMKTKRNTNNEGRRNLKNYGKNTYTVQLSTYLATLYANMETFNQDKADSEKVPTNVEDICLLDIGVDCVSDNTMNTAGVTLS